MIQIKSKTGKVLKEVDAANLCDANLYGANLRGANLYGANLYGANLYGANLRGADLRGADIDGETVTKQPIILSSLRWFVLITDNYMRIGCQRHTHDEWAAFSDEEIKNMDSHAPVFWGEYKGMLLGICESMKG